MMVWLVNNHNYMATSALLMKQGNLVVSNYWLYQDILMPFFPCIKQKSTVILLV